jgi:hypothetical protein
MSTQPEPIHPPMRDGGRLSGPEQVGRLLAVAGTPDTRDGINSDHAARTAMNWRLGATMFTEIRARGLESRFAADTLGLLRGAHLATVMRNRVLRRRGLDVLRALATAGIQPVVMKGGARLLAAPTGTNCTRFMEDLDLLVPLPQHARAHQVLSGLGFSPTSEANVHHGPTLRDRDTGVVIEVHHRPMEFGRAAFTEQFLTDARTVTLDTGQTIKIPSPRHQILHNMIHAQESHGNYIYGIADLRHLFEFAESCVRHVGDFEWPWLIRSAGDLGLRQHFLSWVYMAHGIFGLPLPAGQNFRHLEKLQFQRFRNAELKPRRTNIASDVMVFHYLTMRGVLSLKQLGSIYLYWATHGLELAARRFTSSNIKPRWSRATLLGNS